MSDTLEEIILAHFQGSFSKRESRMIATDFWAEFLFLFSSPMTYKATDSYD